MAAYAPKECLYCHHMFSPRRRDQKFCCKQHKNTYNVLHAYHAKKQITATCPHCGRDYKTSQSKPAHTCGDPACVNKEKKISRGIIQKGYSYGLNVDPYKTGALRSDAQFCPVI